MTTLAHQSNGHAANEPRFVERVLHLPLVEDSIALLSNEYTKIKARNILLEAFASGVQSGIVGITATAFHFSKVVVPYRFLDRVACDGLDKVEHWFPAIKDPAPKNYEEFKIAVYSLLSGIEKEGEIPIHLLEALSARIMTKISNIYSKPTSPAGNIFRILAKKMLESLDTLVDFIFPPTTDEEIEEAEDDLKKIIKALITKLKQRIRNVANFLAKEEKRAIETILSFEDIMNVIEHGLENIIKNLKNMKHIGAFKNILRLGALSIAGVLLSTISATNKFLSSPKIKALIKKFKDIMKLTFNIIYAVVHRIYRTVRNEVHVVLMFVQEHIFKYIWIMHSSPNKVILHQEVHVQTERNDQALVSRSVNTSNNLVEELSEAMDENMDGEDTLSGFSWSSTTDGVTSDKMSYASLNNCLNSFGEISNDERFASTSSLSQLGKKFRLF